jgi:hypothetical protein
MGKEEKKGDIRGADKPTHTCCWLIPGQQFAIKASRLIPCNNNHINSIPACTTMYFLIKSRGMIDEIMSSLQEPIPNCRTIHDATNPPQFT